MRSTNFHSSLLSLFLNQLVYVKIIELSILEREKNSPLVFIHKIRVNTDMTTHGEYFCVTFL